jgi:uncharacterized protein YbbC (DUF1343 family)
MNNLFKHKIFRQSNVVLICLLFIIILIFKIFFPKPLELGIDRIGDYKRYLKKKKIALITNPSGVNSSLKISSDIIQKSFGKSLKMLFAPEHGLRGDRKAGEDVASYIDRRTGLKVLSLYGRTNKPTPEMLKDIDVVLFDIQDTGARFYTYIYTMALTMEACKENNKKFIVLDRPNPLGGVRVEGNILEKEFSSFIGKYPMPIIHGMTVGELALMFKDKYIKGVDLDVIKMKRWKREMLFTDTRLNWVPTSPNIPKFHSALLYPGTGLVGEAGIVSIGIGTPFPFEILGASWIKNPEGLSERLNNYKLKGVIFRPIYFTPNSRKPIKLLYRGVQIHITDPASFSPVDLGLTILYDLRQNWPKRFKKGINKNKDMFDKAAGTDKTRKLLLEGKSVEYIKRSWQKDLKDFKKSRKKYLLY